MRTTVQRAYVGSSQTLISSEGRVYIPALNEWIPYSGSPEQISRVPGVYERWSDVPAAWLGGCPYFR